MLKIINFKNVIYACILLSIILVNSKNISGNSNVMFIRAEIYYYGWDLLTRYALSPEDVRMRHKIKIIIIEQDEVTKFIKWLRINELKSVSKPEKEDARLVIDLFKSNGVRETYYASRFSLLSEDSLRKRSIDDSFKDMFCLTRGFDESKK